MEFSQGRLRGFPAKTKTNQTLSTLVFWLSFAFLFFSFLWYFLVPFLGCTIRSPTAFERVRWVRVIISRFSSFPQPFLPRRVDNSRPLTRNSQWFSLQWIRCGNALDSSCLQRHLSLSPPSSADLYRFGSLAVSQIVNELSLERGRCQWYYSRRKDSHSLSRARTLSLPLFYSLSLSRSLFHSLSQTHNGEKVN